MRCWADRGRPAIRGGRRQPVVTPGSILRREPGHGLLGLPGDPGASREICGGGSRRTSVRRGGGANRGWSRAGRWRRRPQGRRDRADSRSRRGCGGRRPQEPIPEPHPGFVRLRRRQALSSRLDDALRYIAFVGPSRLAAPRLASGLRSGLWDRLQAKGGPSVAREGPDPRWRGTRCGGGSPGRRIPSRRQAGVSSPWSAPAGAARM